jgi:hypothetical protein
MPTDQVLSGVRYKGDVARGEMVLPVKGNALRKAFQSPLVLFSGKAGAYDGEKSFNDSQVKLQVAGTSDPIVRFIEFDVVQQKTGTIAANSNSGSTALVLTSGDEDYVREYDVLHFGTRDLNVRVTAKNGVNLTIERPIGSYPTSPRTVTPTGATSNADANLISGDEYRNLGRAASNVSTTLAERLYNAVEERVAATQIMRNDQTYSTRRLIQESNDRAKQTTREQRKQQELFYMMEEAESQFLFGKMEYDSQGRVNATGSSNSTGSTAAEEFSTTDGIFNVIETYASSNVLTPQGATLGQGSDAMTYDLISEYVKHLDKETGGGHIHLCSADIFGYVGDVASVISSVNYDIPFVGEKDATDGRHVKTIMTQFGPATFMYHPLLNDAAYADKILSIRPERLELITLRGQELNWVPNSEANDSTSESGYYVSDMGLVCAYATEHFILEDITAPA